MKKIYIKCKDYLVSNKEFELVNKENELLTTFPIPKDLDRYYKSKNYRSHTNAKKKIIDKVYQIIKMYSLYKKEKLVYHLLKRRKSILDIGCATGDFINTCKIKGWDVWGIEPSKVAIKNAKMSIKKYIQNSSELESVKKSYEIITMWHVLEHIPHLQSTIENLKRILSSEGYLIIAVPNYKSFDAQYYKQYWAAYDVPRHVHHFSKNAIKTIFQKNGLELQKIKPMYFDSFYVSILSEKYKNNKVNYIRAFLIGFYSNIYGFFKKEYSSHIYILKHSK